VPHSQLDKLLIILRCQKEAISQKFEEVLHCVYNMSVEIIKP
jgi:hypothetical protein